MKHVFASLSVLLMACHEDIAYYTGNWPVHTEVRYWMEPDPDIDPELAQLGCAAWSPEGVLCQAVSDPDEADIRYHFVRQGCGELGLKLRSGERTDAVLGVSDPSGDVDIHLDCFDSWPRVKDEDVQAVIAHETGHQFGLEHIWDDCETGPDSSDWLSGVCGRAIMNAGIWPMLTRMTLSDHEAFCLGSEPRSVVPFPDRLERLHAAP